MKKNVNKAIYHKVNIRYHFTPFLSNQITRCNSLIQSLFLFLMTSEGESKKNKISCPRFVLFSREKHLETIQCNYFHSFLLNFVLFFQTFQLLSLSPLLILTRIKPCHISGIKRNWSYFCVTLSDSVYNKQIIT